MAEVDTDELKRIDKVAKARGIDNPCSEGEHEISRDTISTTAGDSEAELDRGRAAEAEADDEDVQEDPHEATEEISEKGPAPRPGTARSWRRSKHARKQMKAVAPDVGATAFIVHTCCALTERSSLGRVVEVDGVRAVGVHLDLPARPALDVGAQDLPPVEFEQHPLPAVKATA